MIVVVVLSAPESSADAHEDAERAAGGSHRLAERGDELAAAQTEAERLEAAEQKAGRHADGEAHHEAHLDLVEARLAATPAAATAVSLRYSTDWHFLVVAAVAGAVPSLLYSIIR